VHLTHFLATCRQRTGFDFLLFLLLLGLLPASAVCLLAFLLFHVVSGLLVNVDFKLVDAFDGELVEFELVDRRRAVVAVEAFGHDRQDALLLVVRQHINVLLHLRFLLRSHLPLGRVRVDADSPLHARTLRAVGFFGERALLRVVYLVL